MHPLNPLGQQTQPGEAPVLLALLLFSAAAAWRETAARAGSGCGGHDPAPGGGAAAAQWRQVENGVDRALAWLASRQAADGSFPTLPQGQPAVTSLAVMAFCPGGISRGLDLMASRLRSGHDFVIACQRPDGLFSYAAPAPVYQMRRASHTRVL